MKSVCFTGACPDMTRAELTEKASEKFEVKSSVTKDLDFLVCADPNSGSTKLEKAKNNGTRVISYEEFLEMLDSDDEDDDESDNFDDDMYNQKQTDRIVKKLHDMFGVESVRIRTRVEANPLPVTASKFGGLPYWTHGEEFPKNKDGELFMLLAQINFAEVPQIPDFPTSGLLQIFVESNWGRDCEVVWRESICAEDAMSESELREMGVKTSTDVGKNNSDFPFEKEFALSFEKMISVPVPSNEDFDEKLNQVEEALGLPVFDLDSQDCFEEDDFKKFYNQEQPYHQIGGYPFFTQNDVRSEGDILLFQMDSEMGEGKDGKKKGWEILWGDCGVSNFFISREDLKKRDFSKVLYNWDCY